MSLLNLLSHIFHSKTNIHYNQCNQIEWVKKTHKLLVWISLNASEWRKWEIWMNLWRQIISLMNPFFEWTHWISQIGYWINILNKLLLSFSSHIQFKIKGRTVLRTWISSITLIQDTNLQVFCNKIIFIKLQYNIKYNLINDNVNKYYL